MLLQSTVFNVSSSSNDVRVCPPHPHVGVVLEIRAVDPDPDPAVFLNADPDPALKHL